MTVAELREVLDAMSDDAVVEVHNTGAARELNEWMAVQDPDGYERLVLGRVFW